MPRPELQVACALIEAGGKVLCTQRSRTMSMPLKWEFPGGKLMEGETASACLLREVEEELGLTVEIRAPLPPRRHQYETFAVTLYPFVCAIIAGDMVLHEHEDMCWLSADELERLDWAEADWPIIAAYQELVKPQGRL